MSSKRIICTAIAFAAYLLFTAFMIDCSAQLTLDVNASISEYERDKEWCDYNSSASSGLCNQEANASFNFNIDQNIAAFGACCCANDIPSCC